MTGKVAFALLLTIATLFLAAFAAPVTDNFDKYPSSVRDCAGKCLDITGTDSVCITDGKTSSSVPLAKYTCLNRCGVGHMCIQL